jgi:hypothetical protein
MVKVKWSNPTTANLGTGSYKLFAGLDSTSLRLIATIANRDSSYVDSNKVAGKTYYYKIKSVDADGVESDFTKAYSISISSYIYILLAMVKSLHLEAMMIHLQLFHKQLMPQLVEILSFSRKVPILSLRLSE